jgi:hypothetical protein
MTRHQLRALGSGFIELANIVFSASVVASLFSTGPLPQAYAMLQGVGLGIILGVALYAAALNIIGTTGEA